MRPRHEAIGGYGVTATELARKALVLPARRREVNSVLKLFVAMQAFAADARRRQDGQTMAEYGVVLSVITLAVLAAFTLLSENVRDAITNAAGLVPG